MRAKRRFLIFVFLLFLPLTILLAPSSCKREKVDIDANKKVVSLPKNEEPKKEVIKFGVISRYNPMVMYENYQPIMDYLTASTPYKFELKLGSTYNETEDDLHYGVTDIASLGGVTFIDCNLKFNAKSILRPRTSSGDIFYRSIIITKEDNNIYSLNDLKGKSFAFASIKSTSGNLIPRYLLFNHGIKLEDLKSYINLRHHDAVAQAVLKGEYDAGAVKDVVALKYKPRGLRFLAQSDPIPSVPITVRKDADPKMVEAVKKVLLKLNPKNPLDWEIMKNWDEEFRYGFIEAHDDDYERIKELILDIPKVCGKTCHRGPKG
ncbi:MAG: hypothetical protein A3C43_05600 [Candidatus Schekmanbacteria bacterium RIFCSPHIGHO2_02_FULL_38_11]|uniref:Phosphonate ABC transporter substrate-binding protein n=1 Tax=Candidatus Schekmanbacteria bacterium RIFCSPLOWO2_12_FULL_38_15 TaxID=1817883 RepID=A0A1F7SM49_9BACT|nr:MAG: hypothetical protein A2043_01275 [Candidatus Schekmanbacteria bacterium GWA2_38_9]OGL51016.1 MAG: hypothetical protein A3H37_11105 [Candidatus Schekmanbacteria bacterium RIFCSPLOWO2_02_FULL_38_14]OGL53864.1 MAG: hypothetical protein A3C43_05600 [Candidatus Schekmanbacteria bacterium RIFCSPHIGHO2_02_FULL_38_11]OGL54855.1 MAG: hypothetical protein A3G31_01905 [Candidatus Schekmanbacteria bacterium RIFCSPLOWO2_12_FULL_38_15]